MCGIVGLFLKNKALEPELGRMMSGMLATMCDRGPDSAGFAVYGSGDSGHVKLTVRAMSPNFDFASLASRLSEAVGSSVTVEVRESHGIFTVPEDAEQTAGRSSRQSAMMCGSWARAHAWKSTRKSGAQMRWPSASISTRWQGRTASPIPAWRPSSAVTTDGAHPFSTGRDQCLVHNGSLSNHNALRRQLKRNGLNFETDNDTEVAAGYLTWRMSKGDSLGDALKHSLDDLDGFYTFVVGTEDGFGVLRDPIACKPAVMAETDDYVAFGSEYRALAGLPGIEKAHVWEPKPATVYFWERH